MKTRSTLSGGRRASLRWGRLAVLLALAAVGTLVVPASPASAHSGDGLAACNAGEICFHNNGSGTDTPRSYRGVLLADTYSDHSAFEEAPTAEVEFVVHAISARELAVTDLATGKTVIVDSYGNIGDGTQDHQSINATLVSRCGVESWGIGGLFKRPYCDFTRTAQQMVVAGSTAALAAAICVATSGIMCVVAVGAAAALAVYVNEHGLCPRDVRVGYSGTFVVRCV